MEPTTIMQSNFPKKEVALGDTPVTSTGKNSDLCIAAKPSKITEVRSYTKKSKRADDF